MAVNLWGKIYYKDTFAGILSQEAGGRCVFTYDESYMESALPAISYTLPLQAKPHLSEYGLHPFFDNLCAEGWLKNAQARALGLRRDDRFSLLLAFGTDLAGAVSVIDPEPVGDIKIDHGDPEKHRGTCGEGVAFRGSAETRRNKAGSQIPPGKTRRTGQRISPNFRHPHCPAFWDLSI